MRYNNTVIFILPVTSQPRYLKRIKAFSDSGFNYKIFSFEREYFKGDVSYDFISLGKMKHGNYIRRISVLGKGLFKLMRNREVIKNAEIIYVFGLDNLILIKSLLVVLKIKKPVVYEVSDIRKIMFEENFLSNILRKLERNLIKGVSFVTVTSPYFINDYYVPFLNVNRNRFLTIENKLITNLSVPLKDNRIGKRIRLGYFGVLRCQKSWDLIYELAKNYPDDVEIYIRGYLMNLSDFHNRVEELGNIIYGGEYTSPNDLADMYNNIDISIIGNVSKNIDNSKIALPNRFYESLHFHVPMITHADTAVARKVNSLNVGWEVNFNDIPNTVRKLLTINREDINSKIKNTYVDVDETVGIEDHQKLIDKVHEYL